MADRITIRKPDDWHLHVRDGAMLKAALPFTAAHFGRAIIMPNLLPPVLTVKDAIAYRKRLIAALPEGSNFQPLMTCYLTDASDPDDVEAGFREGVFTAVKMYPANATTNSAYGVTDFQRIRRVLARMEKIGMTFLIHGEEADPEIDVFDREAVFIERRLAPMTKDFPGLDWLGYGNRPYMYCMPVIKRREDRDALRKAATSGDSNFFLGTDSAPHPVTKKLNVVGAAGLFNSPVAIESYAQVFAEENALDRLEAFTSLNGPKHYRLPPNTETITLERNDWTAPEEMKIDGPEERALIHRGGETIPWKIVAQ